METKRSDVESCPVQDDIKPNLDGHESLGNIIHGLRLCRLDHDTRWEQSKVYPNLYSTRPEILILIMERVQALEVGLYSKRCVKCCYPRIDLALCIRLPNSRLKSQITNPENAIFCVRRRWQ